MKIDFTKKLTTLDGKEFQDDTKEVVANVLMNATEGNSIKLYDLATKIYKDGTVELDDTDADIVKSELEKSKLPVIVKGQLLKLISK